MADITGAEFDDFLESFAGADTVNGGEGNDTLVSSGEADGFASNNGPFDLLIGGPGADIFVINPGGAAVVADFSLADGDRIEIHDTDVFRMPNAEGFLDGAPDYNGFITFAGDDTTLFVGSNIEDFQAVIDSAHIDGNILF